MTRIREPDTVSGVVASDKPVKGLKQKFSDIALWYDVDN